MESLLSGYTMSTAEIERAYRAGAGQWTGCDWPTAFGKMVLNLNGLKAAQALLLARATSGNERAQWHSAVTWLTAIEQEAARAAEQARQALTRARARMLPQALSHVQQACAIEAKYHSRLVWQPLRAAIEAALAASGDESSP